MDEMTNSLRLCGKDPDKCLKRISKLIAQTESKPPLFPPAQFYCIKEAQREFISVFLFLDHWYLTLHGSSNRFSKSLAEFMLNLMERAKRIY